MSSTVSYPSPRENVIVPDVVLGMVFLLVTELMLFGGFISAFLVNRAGNFWPPYSQPRLPIAVTAVNTIILLISGFTIYLVLKNYTSEKENHHSGDVNFNKKSHIWLIFTIVLGLTFVIIQGSEWVKLIGFGLTTSSSLFAAFFYIIIGIHAFHVLVGLSILIYLLNVLRSSFLFESTKDKILACSLYWYFVVAIWPVLYLLVYIM